MKKTNTLIHIEADKFYNMVWDGFVKFQDFILENGGANRSVLEAYNDYLDDYKNRTWFCNVFSNKIVTFDEYSETYNPSKDYYDYLNRYQHFYEIDGRFKRLIRVTLSAIQNNAVIDVSISDYDFVLNWIDRSDEHDVQYNSWSY